MKNLFTILFVTLLASCGTTQTEEAVVETDSTTVELPVEVEVVDTTAVDTTVSE
jgi:hypothetical protein